MTESQTEVIPFRIKALAAYQLVGGLLGLGFVIYLITTLTNYTVALICLLIVSFGLFSYSIFCGLLIYKNVREGLMYSWFNQMLQVFSFAISGYGFQYIAGTYLSIVLNIESEFTVALGWGLSSWQLNFNQVSELRVLNFNLVAAFILVFIDRQNKIIKEQHSERELASIGSS